MKEPGLKGAGPWASARNPKDAAAPSSRAPIPAPPPATIAVISTAGDEPQGGIAVPLYRWRRLVLVPRGHALDREGAAPSIRELVDLPLVSYDSSTRPGSSLQRAFASAGLEVGMSMSSA